MTLASATTRTTGLGIVATMARLQAEHEGPGTHDDVASVRDCRSCLARYGHATPPTARPRWVGRDFDVELDPESLEGRDER